MNLSKQMMLSVILSLAAGIIFGEIGWLQYPLRELGNIFVSLLKMAVIPIAFVSIAKSILDIGNGRRVSAVSAKALILAAGMSIAGVILGLTLMTVIGTPLIESGQIAFKEAKAPTILEFIRNCIPANPFKSFSEGNMLQIITLAFLVGIASLFTGEKEKIQGVLDTLQKICFKIAGYVMSFAPIGVFSILYPAVAKYASHVVEGYFVMAGALVLGSVIYTLIVSLPLMYMHHVNGVRLFKALIGKDIIYAIAGGATSTLAPRMAFLREKISISHELVNYLSPLLSVLMRTGSCICVGIYTAFAANVYGVDLSIEKLIVVVLLTVIALTCAPGIIGGTLMDCAIIWAAVGIPLEAIALLIGVDYIMDLIRTVLNIQGGEIVTACVDGMNKKQRRNRYVY